MRTVRIEVAALTRQTCSAQALSGGATPGF